MGRGISVQRRVLVHETFATVRSVVSALVRVAAAESMEFRMLVHFGLVLRLWHRPAAVQLVCRVVHFFLSWPKVVKTCMVSSNHLYHDK